MGVTSSFFIPTMVKQTNKTCPGVDFDSLELPDPPWLSDLLDQLEMKTLDRKEGLFLLTHTKAAASFTCTPGWNSIV